MENQLAQIGDTNKQVMNMMASALPNCFDEINHEDTAAQKGTEFGDKSTSCVPGSSNNVALKKTTKMASLLPTNS